MVKTANESPIWNFLKSKNLSDGAAAGIMGNLEQESGFDPGITNGIGAEGLAQWLGSRKTALIHYADSRHEPPTSLDAQLNYLWKEMSSGSYGSVSAMNNMTPGQAAAYFMDNFEKPGDNSAPARESYASSIYSKFTGKSAPYNGGDYSGGSSTTTGGDASGGASSSTSATAFPTGSDPIDILNKALTLQSFDITHPVNSLAQDAGAIGLRFVLVLLGLILIIFGLVAVVEKAGVKV